MSARSLAAALALASIALSGPAFAKEPLAGAAGPKALTVNVDETTALKLNQPANSIIIGNATVVDVTVHDARTLLITGKAFGSTNLTVLDKSGQSIYTARLSVADAAEDQLTIVRGTGTNTYSCVDKCRATAMVGDTSGFFSEVMATVSGKAQAAKGNN